LPLWPRDYELEGVILRHKLAALDNDEGARGAGDVL
jgi:hypothetical protein